MEGFDWIARWWSVITTVATTIALALVWWLGKTFVRQEELSEVKTTVIGIKDRVEELEHRVETMPTSDEVNKLRLEMSDMRGELKALRAELKPINHLSQLLLEQRLNEK